MRKKMMQNTVAGNGADTILLMKGMAVAT